MYTVDMLPAYLGDSLWIEYGDPARPNRFLIDGGLVGTVDAIERKIHAVADKEGRCRLELLVLTHVDADHIEGLIKLLGKPDLPLDIDDVWFNGQDHLPQPGAKDGDEFLGAKQGEFLSALIRERRLPWNTAFDERTVFVPHQSVGNLPRKNLRGGMEIVLLSPTFKELVRLSDRWEDELEAAGLLNATHAEVLEALKNSRNLAPDDEFLGEEDHSVAELVSQRTRSDSSPANGSSIAFVAAFEGVRCLFGADAYSPVLRDAAKRLAEEEGRDRLELAAFKIPHHGSKSNLHDDLLAQLDCRRFLVSTDGGRFRHPDDQAIARLVGGSWRPAPEDDRPVDLCFNYSSDFNSKWDDSQLREDWNYRTTYPPAKDDESEPDPGLHVSLA